MGHKQEQLSSFKSASQKPTTLLTIAITVLMTAVGFWPGSANAQDKGPEQIPLADKSAILKQYIEKLKACVDGFDSDLEPYQPEFASEESEFVFRGKGIHSFLPRIGIPTNHPLLANQNPNYIIGNLKPKLKRVQDQQISEIRVANVINSDLREYSPYYQSKDSVIFSHLMFFQVAGYSKTVAKLVAHVDTPFKSFCAKSFEQLLQLLSNIEVAKLQGKQAFQQTIDNLKRLRQHASTKPVQQYIDRLLNELKAPDKHLDLTNELRESKALPTIASLTQESCDLSKHPQLLKLISKLLKEPEKLKEILNCQSMTRLNFIDKKGLHYHTVGSLCYSILSVASCGSFQTKAFYTPESSNIRTIPTINSKKIDEITDFFIKLPHVRRLQIAVEFSEWQSTLAFQQLLLLYPKSIKAKLLKPATTRIMTEARVAIIARLTVKFAPNLIDPLQQQLKKLHSRVSPAVWSLRMFQLLKQKKATLEDFLEFQRTGQAKLDESKATSWILQEYINNGEFSTLLNQLSKSPQSMEPLAWTVFLSQAQLCSLLPKNATTPATLSNLKTIIQLHIDHNQFIFPKQTSHAIAILNSYCNTHNLKPLQTKRPTSKQLLEFINKINK